MLTYLWFFLAVIARTLGAVVICGLVVSLCRRLFVYLMGNGAGRAAVIATSVIGTPIHELGHAVMCLLFGHKITDMALWQPADKSGTLGYVTHAYNPKNPYHILGNLFIGIGPIFSGLGVLSLLLWLCFPYVWDMYRMAAWNAASGGFGELLVFGASLSSFPRLLVHAATDAAVPIWARILGAVGLLSVSLHIELSLEDIKGAAKAIPLYLLLAALLTAVCGLLGEGAMTAVGDALARFSCMLAALFSVVILISLLQVLVALPVFLLRKLFGR